MVRQETYIYVIQKINSPDTRIKIGKTIRSNPYSRVDEYMKGTGNPDNYVVLAFISESELGQTEAEIHRQFARERVESAKGHGNEWFEISHRLSEYVASLSRRQYEKLDLLRAKVNKGWELQLQKDRQIASLSDENLQLRQRISQQQSFQGLQREQLQKEFAAQVEALERKHVKQKSRLECELSHSHRQVRDLTMALEQSSDAQELQSFQSKLAGTSQELEQAQEIRAAYEAELQKLTTELERCKNMALEQSSNAQALQCIQLKLAGTSQELEQTQEIRLAYEVELQKLTTELERYKKWKHQEEIKALNFSNRIDKLAYEKRRLEHQYNELRKKSDRGFGLARLWKR